MLSPQNYFQEQDSGRLIVTNTHIKLTLHDNTTLTFPLAAKNNLLLILTTDHFEDDKHGLVAGIQATEPIIACPNVVLMTVMQETNQNLTAAQKELLIWHQRLGHADMQRVQQLLNKNSNIIQCKEQKASSCSRPLCTACQMAKQGRLTIGKQTGQHGDR